MNFDCGGTADQKGGGGGKKVFGVALRAWYGKAQGRLNFKHKCWNSFKVDLIFREAFLIRCFFCFFPA